MSKSKERVIVIDTTLTLPENVTSLRELRLVLDQRTIETARKATDELLVARRLTVDPEDVSVADPISFLILSQDPDISGADAAFKAGDWYRKQKEEARREGLMVGMTMYNDLKNEPLPYSDEDEEDDDTPAWLRDDYDLPEPERNLNNRYERRLKQLYDILNEAGPAFGLSFRSVLDNDMADKLREMGIGAGGTDPDGFHAKGTDAKVSDRAVSKGRNKRGRSEDGQEEKDQSPDHDPVRADS